MPAIHKRNLLFLLVGVFVTGGALSYWLFFSPVTPIAVESRITFKESGQAVCSVKIGDSVIETMAAGELEAYTCGPLVEWGLLPPTAEGVERLGLIYDTGSPNAAFRAALILQKNGQNWELDLDSAGRFDDTQAAASIKALAKDLSAQE